MKINTAVGSRKINRDAKLNINQDVFIVHIFLLFLGAKDLPDCHVRLVSKGCSVISSKSPSHAFRLSSIYY